MGIEKGGAERVKSIAAFAKDGDSNTRESYGIVCPKSEDGNHDYKQIGRPGDLLFKCTKCGNLYTEGGGGVDW